MGEQLEDFAIVGFALEVVEIDSNAVEVSKANYWRVLEEDGHGNCGEKDWWLRYCRSFVSLLSAVVVPGYFLERYWAGQQHLFRTVKSWISLSRYYSVEVWESCSLQVHTVISQARKKQSCRKLNELLNPRSKLDLSVVNEVNFDLSS